GLDVENADVGADADRDLARARAGDAGAEDDDLRRTYAGDAREQDAATAVGRLQTPRARLHRELARDLAHRREQRQRAVVELDRLVGDGAHAALDEHARQRLVGGEVEIREEDELRAHMAELFAAEVGRRVVALAERGIVPGLATVLVGDDPASRVYVGSKEKGCAALGMRSFGHRPPADATTSQLVALVEELNARPDVHGILVQLPLPDTLDEDAVIQAIAPAKDV